MITMLKFGARVVLSNLGFHAPYSLNFAITYKCNSHCQNCWIWKSRPKDELTLGEIRKLTKHLKFVKWLRLTGGEPFLRGDFVDIVRAMDRNIPDLFMLTTTTNAILPDDIYKKIVGTLRFFHKKFIVAISLDGDRGTHDRLRGVPGNWERAVRLYTRLKALRRRHRNLDVFFGYTIYPANVGMFERTYEELKERLPGLKPTDIHVNIFHVSDIYYGNAKLRTPRGFAEKAAAEIAAVRRMRGPGLGPIGLIESTYLRLAPRYLRNGRSPMACNILDLSCFLDPKGDVYPCVTYGRRIGNVRDFGYDLEKAVASPEARRLSAEIKAGRCAQCWTPCEAHNLIISNWLKT